MKPLSTLHTQALLLTMVLHLRIWCALWWAPWLYDTRVKGELFRFSSEYKMPGCIVTSKDCVFITVRIVRALPGDSNSLYPTSSSSLPKACSHGDFKTRDSSLPNYLFNRKARRIARIMFVDGSGALKKTNDLSMGHCPKSSVLCTTMLFLITVCARPLWERLPRQWQDTKITSHEPWQSS